jgi:reactive intermediate/imine deaminase
MKRDIIHTDGAPAAVGTYSQAIRTGDLVFISGQIPLVPETMNIVEGDFADRARQVFENLKSIAEAAGGSLDNAVKLTIFLTDLDNFAAVNEVMAEYCSEPFPARAAVEVAALPKDVDVEADAVIVL